MPPVVKPRTQAVAPSEEPTPLVEPESPSQTRARHLNRVERMREYFAQRPKETIKIRKEDGEQWVQINGYSFRIQPEVRVQVPVDVADLLRTKGVI